MDQAHGIKIFNQLIKRSFQPDTQSNFPMKIARPFLDSDPLTLSQEEFNNNDTKTDHYIDNGVDETPYQSGNEYVCIFCIKMFDLKPILRFKIV